MQKIKHLIIPVLVSLLIGSMAHGALWEWSKTASTNATADPSINWSEGQSPSSVNDSARAMMARVAEWRDDLSGLLTTAGTSTAYTVTTNQGLNAIPTDGQALAFTVHTENGLAPTLTADGGTAYAIQSAAGTPIGAGVLISGAPYMVKFKLASTAWVLHGFYGQPFVIPLGAMVDYTGTTSPNSNFILPVGQCISRTTYSSYFALVSTRYGVCDGSTTFAAPDFRGTISAAKDDMGGTARNLITNAGSGCTGTTMGLQCGSQNTTLLQTNLPNVTLTGTATGSLTTSAVNVPISTLTGTSVYPNFETITASAGGTQSIRQWTGNNTTQNLNFGGFLTAAAGSTSGSLSTSESLGGSDTPISRLPPIQIVTKLLRIF